MRPILAVLLLLFAADGDGDGRKGNALYQAERYAEAAAAYRVGLEGRDATLADPTTSRLFYNLGNAHHRLGQYDEASVAYQQAVATAPDAAHFQHASYNAGNNAVAKEDLEAALGHYRRTLLSNPDHAEARHNYELVKRQLEDQQSQDSDQSQDGDGEGDGERGEDDQQQEGDDGQDGENDSQDQGEEGEEQDEQSGENSEQNGGEEEQPGQDGEQGEGEPSDEQQPGEEEPQQGEGEDSEQDGTPPEGEPQPSQAPQNPQQLSQEQAERILQALGAEESELLRQVQRRPVQPRRVEKDW